MSDIRTATELDIPRLQEIRSAVKENILSDPTKVTVKDYQWFISNGPVWIYSEQNQILGFSAGDPKDGTIWALFIDPAHEGKGIGQKLFSAACQSLQDKGHDTISLYTAAQSRAEKFYLAAGWKNSEIDNSGDVRFTKQFKIEPS